MKTLTAEHKMKIGIANSIALKGVKHTSERIERHRQKMLGQKRSDESKKNISNALKIAMNRTEVKEKLKKANIGKKYSEETKKKMKNVTLNLWQNKEYREKQLYNIKKCLHTHEVALKISSSNIITKNTIAGKIKSSNASLKCWKNTAYRQNQLKRMKEYLHNDVVRKKISINTKIAMQNPIIKQKLKDYRKTVVFPKKDTKPEIKIQDYLQKLNINFIKHKYINIVHGYQVDIFIPEINTIIECDGDYTHCNPKKYDKNFIRYPSSKKKITAKQCWEIDKVRTQELVEKGYKVLRLWEHEINRMDIDDFKNKIISFCD